MSDSKAQSASPKPSNELSKLLDELFINYSDPIPKIKLKAALQKHIDERVIDELRYFVLGTDGGAVQNRIKELKANLREDK